MKVERTDELRCACRSGRIQLRAGSVYLYLEAEPSKLSESAIWLERDDARQLAVILLHYAETGTLLPGEVKA